MRNVRAHVWVFILVAGLSTACARTTAEAPPTETSPADGTLDVVLTYVPHSAYMEGAIPFVRIKDSGGTIVFEQAMDRHDASSTLRTDLPADDYVFESYERPCDANCGMLDPWEADSCTASLTLAGGQTQYLAVLVDAGHGCTVSFPAD